MRTGSNSDIGQEEKELQKTRPFIVVMIRIGIEFAVKWAIKEQTDVRQDGSAAEIFLRDRAVWAIGDEVLNRRNLYELVHPPIISRLPFRYPVGRDWNARVEIVGNTWGGKCKVPYLLNFLC